jgi:hypothetical protein
MSSVFLLSPPPLMILFLGALGIGIPTILVLVIKYKEGYRNKTNIATFIFLVVIGCVFSALLVWHHQVGVEINEDRLIINAPPYSTNLILKKEDIVRAFVIDWSINTSYVPTLRTGGTGWGSYKTGWFKLANDVSALLVTSSSKNLCIETTEGYYVLLNPNNFESFIAAFNILIAS